MPEDPIHAAQAAASKLNIPYVTTNLSAVASHLTLSSAAEGSPDSVSQLVNDPSDVPPHVGDHEPAQGSPLDATQFGFLGPEHQIGLQTH
ncbi:hypothetical protein ACFXTH_002967 [Malus domestica]